MARLVDYMDRDFDYYRRQANDGKTHGRWLLVCEHCGRGFWSNRRHARVCSDTCRQARHRARKPKARRADVAAAALETKRLQRHDKTCAVCGAPFSVDGTQTAALYCGAACRQKAYRQRQRAGAA